MIWISVQWLTSLLILSAVILLEYDNKDLSTFLANVFSLKIRFGFSYFYFFFTLWFGTMPKGNIKHISTKNSKSLQWFLFYSKEYQLKHNNAKNAPSDGLLQNVVLRLIWYKEMLLKDQKLSSTVWVSIKKTLINSCQGNSFRVKFLKHFK